MAHVPGAFRRWWNGMFSAAGGVSSTDVQTLIDTAIAAGPENYKGAIDCSANPNYPAAEAGDTYRVSVNGKIGGASGQVVKVGYRLICTTDGTTAGTEAAKGQYWDVLPEVATYNAALVPFTAAGNIAATDVQAAIEELDGEKQASLGFTAENVANKSTSISNDTGSDTKYPSVKAVEDYVLAEFAQFDSKPQVAYASTAALPANTYANGTAGVGATLTGNTNGPLVVDGVTILVGQVGERILVAGESASANNGWYVITQQGVALVSPYILTRATESNQAAEMGSGYLTSVIAPNGVTAGSSNNGKVFISVAAANPFVVGTTALTFSAVGTGTVSDTVYGAGWNGDTTVAPSKNAVYDKVETKQDGLVSGTSIKTVDGVSILGSGDIASSIRVQGAATTHSGASLSNTNMRITAAQLAANSIYQFQVLARLSTGNNTGFLIGITASSAGGAVVARIIGEGSSSGSVSGSGLMVFDGAQGPFATFTGNTTVEIKGEFTTPATPGDVVIQFARGGASGSAVLSSGQFFFTARKVG